MNVTQIVYLVMGCILAVCGYLQGAPQTPQQWGGYIAIAIAVLHAFLPQVQSGSSRARSAPPQLPLVLLVIASFLVFSCAHLPTPDGGSVQATDAGVETCITWAKTNHCVCQLDAGAPAPSFVDASVGK